MCRQLAAALLATVAISAIEAGSPAALFVAAPGSPIAVAGGPQNVAVGDVNGDGKPDLVVPCSKNQTAILLGDGRGGFRPAPDSPLPYPGGEMGLGDVNGDGKLDIALADHDSYAITVLLGDGRGGFAPVRGSPFTGKDGQHPHTHGLALADVNGDGKLDMVIGNNDDGDVSVLLGDGRGGFTRAPGSPFPVGESPYPIAIGEVNGDGHPDIVAPNSGPNNLTVTVLLGDGRGAFRPAPASPFRVADGPYFVALGDVNGDGKPDIVATHDDSSAVSILLGDGRGKFRPAPYSPLDIGRRAMGVVVADVNGDGHADLVAAAGDGVRVLLGDGRGGFRPAPGSPFASGKGVWRLAVADLNGDGKPDVAAVGYESNSVTVLLAR
ncbi:MAG TPA: VCBS repeat-containing protein [Gemmataceae bacterium]|nr:VCBS repeat-containing protein [Gemmataceae bacterium]